MGYSIIITINNSLTFVPSQAATPLATSTVFKFKYSSTAFFVIGKAYVLKSSLSDMHYNSQKKLICESFRIKTFNMINNEI